jgi:hypothetical protein
VITGAYGSRSYCSVSETKGEDSSVPEIKGEDSSGTSLPVGYPDVPLSILIFQMRYSTQWLPFLLGGQAKHKHCPADFLLAISLNLIPSVVEKIVLSLAFP